MTTRANARPMKIPKKKITPPIRRLILSAYDLYRKIRYCVTTIFIITFG